jgi:hypothetical protein
MCATVSPDRAETSSNVGTADEVPEEAEVRCVKPRVEILLSCAPPAAHKNTNTASARSAMIRLPLEPGPNAQLL